MLDALFRKKLTQSRQMTLIRIGNAGDLQAFKRLAAHLDLLCKERPFALLNGQQKKLGPQSMRLFYALLSGKIQMGFCRCQISRIQGVNAGEQGQEISPEDRTLGMFDQLPVGLPRPQRLTRRSV